MIIPTNASEDFVNRINKIDIEAMKAFLESKKEPVFETQLMKFIYDGDLFSCDSLTLYKNHFVLFYVLYRLQDEYAKQNKFLYVHFMRTKLFDYPDTNHCHFFDETLLTFCLSECEDSYCDHHKKLVGDTSVEELSIKYFYYDTDNYDKLDKDTAEAFINGAWEILANYHKLKECFKTLEIYETYDLDKIKAQFRTLAKKYHPDICGDEGKRFSEINRAYKILINTIPLIQNEKKS